MWTQILGGVVTVLGAAVLLLIGVRHRACNVRAPSDSRLNDDDVIELAILHGLHI